MIRFFLLLVAVIATAEVRAASDQQVETKLNLTIMATQKGGRTLDYDPFGGNPFATAFILALEERSTDPLTRIGILTDDYSVGFQQIDSEGDKEAVRELVSIKDSRRRKIALVITIAEYLPAKGLDPLPGAAFDAIRISKALDAAGFTTDVHVIKTVEEYRQAVAKFELDSEDSDVAVIYTTGHGIQIDDNIYLLDTDYSIKLDKKQLPDHAIELSEIRKSMKARLANLILYAGCRDNPLAVSDQK